MNLTQDIPWEFDPGARKNNYYEEWQSNIRASNLSDMHYDISCTGSSKEREKADDIRWYLIKYCYQPLSFIVSFQVHNQNIGDLTSRVARNAIRCAEHTLYIFQLNLSSILKKRDGFMQFGDDLILFPSVFTFAAIYSMMMSNYRTWHLYYLAEVWREQTTASAHRKKV